MKRRNFLSGVLTLPLVRRFVPPPQIIDVDLATEKEKYIRLARIYIDEQAAKYCSTEFLHGPFFDQRLRSPEAPQ